MGRSARRKGAEYEREAADILSRVLHAPRARRARQFSGQVDADLVGVPDASVEVKARQKHAAVAWYRRARRESAEGTTTLLMLRQIDQTSQCKWLLCIDPDDLERLIEGVVSRRGEPHADPERAEVR